MAATGVSEVAAEGRGESPRCAVAGHEVGRAEDRQPFAGWLTA